MNALEWSSRVDFQRPYQSHTYTHSGKYPVQPKPVYHNSFKPLLTKDMDLWIEVWYCHVYNRKKKGKNGLVDVKMHGISSLTALPTVLLQTFYNFGVY